MKMLLPEKAEEAEHRKLLFHEANVASRWAHPNVINHHPAQGRAALFRDGVFFPRAT